MSERAKRLMKKRQDTLDKIRIQDSNYCGVCDAMSKFSNFTDSDIVLLYQPTTAQVYQMTSSKMYEAFKQVQRFIVDFANDRVPAGVPLRLNLGDLNVANYAIDCEAQDLRNQVVALVTGWKGADANGDYITVSVSGIRFGTRQEMGSYVGYLNRKGLNEVQSITGMQKMLIDNVFGKFLPYQVCGQVVAVENVSRLVPNETAEELRRKELEAIAAAQAKHLAEQQALAQRQQEERIISESQRQTAEQVYHIQQSEQLIRQQEEANRLAIEANRTIAEQARQTALAVTQQAQQATIQKVAEEQRQKAIAEARALALATEEARQKALTAALPQNTQVKIGNNSVVEKTGLTDTFKKVQDTLGAFRTDKEESYVLDTATGNFVDSNGNTYAPDEMVFDTKTGKMKPKSKWSKWWVWVLLILGLGLVGFGLWYYFSYPAKGKDWSDFKKDLK